ncbi:hypothetical protein LCGC14_0787170 [marine sediment metagenome]|uniref:Carbamoyltransferase n=1 Tax=marine sediment metagenome TaxID=412755 RepID=A0A0F9QDH8_9ZZZZ
MLILTIHNGHDSSFTLLKDGDILGHWEIERICRVKHGTGAQTADGKTIHDIKFPIIQEKLRSFGLDIADVDIIGLNGVTNWDCYHQNSFIWKNLKNKFGDPEGQGKCILEDTNPPFYTWTAPLEVEPCWGNYKGKKEIRFFVLRHSMAHSAASYYTSPFKESAVFSWEGAGDFWETAVECYGLGNCLEFLGSYNWKPHYNIFGSLFNDAGHLLADIGTGLDCPGKVMGLSAYGTPRRQWVDETLRLCGYCGKTFQLCEGGRKRWTSMELEYKGAKFSLRENIIQDVPYPDEPIRSMLKDSSFKVSQDFAASIQQALEEYFLDRLKVLYDKIGSENLCISGGVGLNVLANTRALRESPFKNVHVVSCCNDGGLSLGTALYIWHAYLGNVKICKSFNPYLGDTLYDKPGTDTFGAVVEGFPVNFKQMEWGALCKFIAKELLDKKIVGWIQDRWEIGPRALGNRSIFASPLSADMKNIINRVKRREWYRPFAPIVMEEYAGEYFDIDRPAPYMVVVADSKTDKIPAAVHIDGTARLQTVNRAQNRKAWTLLNEFNKLSGVPVLLNTSYNVGGMPIVNYLSDALKLLCDSSMSYVVVDNYVFRKR